MRRERNKLAAAKCRNRRKELTDFLQAVSTRPEWRAHQTSEGPGLPWACEAPGGAGEAGLQRKGPGKSTRSTAQHS